MEVLFGLCYDAERLHFPGREPRRWQKEDNPMLAIGKRYRKHQMRLLGRFEAARPGAAMRVSSIQSHGPSSHRPIQQESAMVGTRKPITRKYLFTADRASADKRACGEKRTFSTSSCVVQESCEKFGRKRIPSQIIYLA